MSHTHDHYDGKDALGHLLDARAKGYSAGSEPHGIETSGIWHAAYDAAKTTAVAGLFLLLAEHYHPLGLPHLSTIIGLAGAWSLWIGGRSAWLGFTRLERLVGVIAEEKYEVDNNREMEKEELKEIYALKGFEGKLLDDVVDVLASDNNRLLDVMLEEELGVKRYCQDHPLLQGLSALIAALFVGTLSVYFYYTFGLMGLAFPTLCYLIAAFASAKISGVSALKSVVWQGAIAFLSITSLYYALTIL